MAEVPYDPYDQANWPADVPAGGPPPDVWIEGDHPTANPDGVTNSNVDYMPKTQEEKAEMLGVPMVEPLDLDPTEAWPTGQQWESREDMLKRIHSPMELVEAKDWAGQHERNLRAGGSVEMKDVKINI